MLTKVTKAKGFSPVSLEITFETQKELDAFTSLCGCVPIMQGVGAAGGILPGTETFSKEAGATYGLGLANVIADKIAKHPYIINQVKKNLGI